MVNITNSIKVPGNSGCRVDIVDLHNHPAVRKEACSLEYALRLQNQRRKQESFHTEILEMRIPQVLSYDEKSFTMEYLHMMDSIEFFELSPPKEILGRIASIVAFINEGLLASTNQSISSKIFINKINEIQSNVDEYTWNKYYKYTANQLKEKLVRCYEIPLGRCHGDLTFSNIMFSIHGKDIGLIDFLDSFLESPLLDIIKLRQDTIYHWTNLRYNVPHDFIKINIIMSWINIIIDREFSEQIQTKVFNIAEILNYFRIAPYVKTEKEHKYLSDILNNLIVLGESLCI